MDLIGNQSVLQQADINDVMFMNIGTAGRLLPQGTDMLAFRNLLHDRVRFLVTLVGIVFSVVLSAVKVGLFLGFTRATVGAIDRSNADLWMASKGANPFSRTVALLAT